MALHENAEERLRRYRLSIHATNTESDSRCNGVKVCGQELLEGHTGPLNTPVPGDGPKNDELWH